MIPQNGFFFYRGRPGRGQATGPLFRLETRACPDPQDTKRFLEELLGVDVTWQRA